MEDNANKPNPGAGKPGSNAGKPEGNTPPTGNQGDKTAGTGANQPPQKPGAPQKPAAAGDAKPAPQDPAKKPEQKPDPKAKAKESKPPKKEKPKKSKERKDNERAGKAGTIVLIILIILMTAGAGVMGYLYYQKYNEQENTAGEVKQLEKQADAYIDSLEARKSEIRLLTSDTVRLFQQLDSMKLEYEAMKKRLASYKYRANDRDRAVRELNKFKQEYTLLLQQQDSELIKLRAIRDEQMKNITELKETVAQKEDIISEREQTIADQEETIKDGQVLAAADFKAVAINSKGKIKVDIKNKGYKPKDLDKLKVEFTVQPNKIAEENIKTYYMVLKEPSGVGLSGNLAGGTFKDVNGKTLYFAAKVDDTYSRSGKTVTLVYDKEPSYEFKEGTNLIEVYCEGHMIGSGTFLVR